MPLPSRSSVTRSLATCSSLPSCSGCLHLPPCSPVPERRTAQPSPDPIRSFMPPKAPGSIPRIVLTCLLTTFCMATAPLAAQTAKPPFTATIGVENLGSQTGPDSYTVKFGSDVFPKVPYQNRSEEHTSALQSLRHL